MAQRQTKIVGMAIENDVLHASLFIGDTFNRQQIHSDIEPPYAGLFRYRVTDEPVSISLPKTLTASALRDAAQALLADICPAPDAIGISIYGSIDTQMGMVLNSPSDADHKPLKGFSVIDAIKPVANGATILVENDANAAAFGEYLWRMDQGDIEPPWDCRRP